MSKVPVKVISTVKCCGGDLIRFKHFSEYTKVEMTCAVYIPPLNELNQQIPILSSEKKIPVIIFLSGLTCTDENVCQKSGILKALSSYHIGLIAPDTSPRWANIPGESESWDFGVGAGYYLDAVEQPWSENYLMYSYIVHELPKVVQENFPVLNLEISSIMGHSMGGHGSLTIALKNPDMFRSVSAFAPIANPTLSPWGIKAFTNFLGNRREEWSKYDASELIRNIGITKFENILVDVGSTDPFHIGGQLLIENFRSACAESGQNVTIRYQEGYDHGYYFISTFIEDHVAFHAHHLKC